MPFSGLTEKISLLGAIHAIRDGKAESGVTHKGKILYLGGDQCWGHPFHHDLNAPANGPWACPVMGQCVELVHVLAASSQGYSSTAI